MADLGAIFATVSRSSTLSIDLYQIATTSSDIIALSQAARSVSHFSLTVKQVGTIIREDDSLPSAEAIETLDDLLVQCNLVLTEIKSVVSAQTSDHRDSNEQYCLSAPPGRQLEFNKSARIEYLRAHLESLKLTLSVLLQCLYTAQGVLWARLRPTISPQQAAAAVANEKAQLEALIIDEQMSILSATRLFYPSRPDARLLMETDSSQSLMAKDNDGPKPSDLYRYQDRFIASLDTSGACEKEWLPAVCGLSRARLERLLERWTRLGPLHEKIRDEERKVEAQRREAQQPRVESDNEDDPSSLPNRGSSGPWVVTPAPRLPEGIQPLFTESSTLPVPLLDTRVGFSPSLSPTSSNGISPRSPANSLSPASPAGTMPASSKSSTLSRPSQAAAAVEAKAKDDELDLEIPWRLCSGAYFWEHVDGKVTNTNTNLPPSHAALDRRSRTEVMASWVCKEAIQEAGFTYTQVQKDRQDGRRTKFETCFCIRQPLSFEQVHALVERTVEIFRQTQPPSPPPTRSRASAEHRASVDRQRAVKAGVDQDRAEQRQLPTANRHPPLERSTSTFGRPPPPLDRSFSLPYSTAASPIANSHTAMPHQAKPMSPHVQQAAPPAYPPHAGPYSPQPYPLPPGPNFHPPPAPDPRHLAPSGYPSPPRRRSRSRTNPGARREYYSSPTTSDSDSGARPKSRDRRRRSEARHSSLSSSSKKRYGGAVGTLATVGGLAALLDGIVDLGVL